MDRPVIPAEAIEAAAIAAAKDDAEPNWYLETERFRDAWRIRMRAALEAAAPHMLAQKALDSVLDISNVRMNSERGDPAFVLGWEAALEEMLARINEVMGGDGE